jgi:hypothetical protein
MNILIVDKHLAPMAKNAKDSSAVSFREYLDAFATKENGRVLGMEVKNGVATIKIDVSDAARDTLVAQLKRLGADVTARESLEYDHQQNLDRLERAKKREATKKENAEKKAKQ